MLELSETMNSISPEECRRLEELDAILREAANEYNRVAAPALMEKQAIIKGRGCSCSI